MRTLIIIFLFFFVSVAYGEDNTIWLEPGESVGPVRVGDVKKAVLKKIGIPNDIKGVPFMYKMYYDNVFIEMNASNYLRGLVENLQNGKKNEKIELEATVVYITSYSPYSKTRGNIGIGSTLPEVLNVFGDTHMKIIRQKPFKAITCSAVYIFKYPANAISSLKEEKFNGYMLNLDYFQEGISFVFKLANGMPKVFAITVSEKDECMVNIDLKKGILVEH